MSRSTLFGDIARALRIARFCDEHHLSTADGLERVAELEAAYNRGTTSRRQVLKTLAGAGGAAVAATVASPATRLFASAPQRTLDVAIVGAGLAGLACADTLASKGVVATLYDANTRTGGRCWSLRGFFPGQTAERGGEFIDNLHKTMLRYASQFNLVVEDVTKQPGGTTYYFGGVHVPEARVVDEFRAFVGVMRRDLVRLTNEVTALSHSDFDRALDQINLAEYLNGQNASGVDAGPIARAAISEAYIAEYGLEPSEQSCLNFLLFIHADRRSKFTPFGVFSDERYHIVDGNDRIVEGLTQSLARPVALGMRLTAVRKTGAGAVELTFDSAGGPVTRVHDIVVLTIPFTVLSGVQLHANLGLSQEKRDAIAMLGYGDNAKMMVGFDSRPWAAQGSNGSSYSDLEDHQATWETNPTGATARRAILTDYSGGQRGASLDPANVQAEAERFLLDLNLVFPGARAAASGTVGTYTAHLEHWPSNPLTLSSYTCYRPGQFTTIAGLEGQPAGNLFFAGEHTNSFYDWQGFMEGAALSGIDAATAILKTRRG